MNKAYSQTGSEHFNEQLHETLQNLGHDIGKSIGSSFIALILGGGYGRGEGAAVLRNGKESLYNDLDLFLILDSPGPVPEAAIRVAHQYEKLLGIDVDIGHPLTPRDLRNLPLELMWQDLFTGHHIIGGDKNILADNTPKDMHAPLPQIEALRLLLNRGSGLLQAIRRSSRMASDPDSSLPDPDFIRRNLQKCILSFGDSLLISHCEYPKPMKNRPEVLRTLISSSSLPADALADLYKSAIRFKSNPDTLPSGNPGMEELLHTADLWVRVVLYSESLRTGKAWKTAAAYAESSFIREPQQHTGKKILRNLVKNSARGTLSFRYPREELYREIVQLLASPEADDAAWKDKAEKFMRLWEHYN